MLFRKLYRGSHTPNAGSAELIHLRLAIGPIALRLTAYLLAVACGAAGMFAFDRGLVKGNRSVPAPAAINELDGARAIAWNDTNLAPQEARNDSKECETDPDPVEAPVVALGTQPSTSESLVTPASHEQIDQTFSITGVTEPASGRYAKLPLATNQAVAFVDVKAGDRVKKGWQVFSHWESPERLQAERTELDKSKKLHEAAKSRWQAASLTVERLRKLRGNVSDQELEDAESNLAVRQSEMEAAELAVAAAESHLVALEFEFNQAFVTSPLEGIVASVDVYPGDRRQVGGPFRGVVILDPRVLNCRCFVDSRQLAQINRLRATSTLETSEDSSTREGSIRATVVSEGREWEAHVVTIGIIADEHTGLIPVVLEVKNSDETLPCGIRVDVTFKTAT